MPFLGCWGRRKTAKEELGRSYYFVHTACCPCFDAFDLFRDDAYDWDRWETHKSWARHVPSPFTCLQVMAWYWPPVVMVAGISGLLGVYVTQAEPRGAPDISHHDLTAPFKLTSFALALLLVFRTNNTYDRWWEARKILGGMLGLTRDIVRQGLTIAKPDSAHLIAMLARWTVAMPYILHHHVTEFTDVPKQLQRVLTAQELDYLERAKHRPTAVAQAASDAAFHLASSDITYIQLSQRISEYADFVAAAERLLRQPIPRAYTRHTSRFIITYIVFLPFALWQTCQWLTPFISALVAFLLIGIENIGIQIEQPFAVLPLDNFSRIIELNVQEEIQMRGESDALLAAARKAAQPASRENGSQQRSSIDFDNLWPSDGRAGGKPPQVPQTVPEDQEMSPHGSSDGSSSGGGMIDGIAVDVAALKRALAEERDIRKQQ